MSLTHSVSVIKLPQGKEDGKPSLVVQFPPTCCLRVSARERSVLKRAWQLRISCRWSSGVPCLSLYVCRLWSMSDSLPLADGRDSTIVATLATPSSYCFPNMIFPC